MLGILMNEYDNSIAISGTHGKTTTTSMVSLILEQCRAMDPTILVGRQSRPRSAGNVRVGHGKSLLRDGSL